MHNKQYDDTILSQTEIQMLDLSGRLLRGHFEHNEMMSTITKYRERMGRLTKEAAWAAQVSRHVMNALHMDHFDDSGAFNPRCPQTRSSDCLFRYGCEIQDDVCTNIQSANVGTQLLLELDAYGDESNMKLFYDNTVVAFLSRECLYTHPDVNPIPLEELLCKYKHNTVQMKELYFDYELPYNVNIEFLKKLSKHVGAEEIWETHDLNLKDHDVGYVLAVLYGTLKAKEKKIDNIAWHVLVSEKIVFKEKLANIKNWFDTYENKTHVETKKLIENTRIKDVSYTSIVQNITEKIRNMVKQKPDNSLNAYTQSIMKKISPKQKLTAGDQMEMMGNMQTFFTNTDMYVYETTDYYKIKDLLNDREENVVNKIWNNTSIQNSVRIIDILKKLKLPEHMNERLADMKVEAFIYALKANAIFVDNLMLPVIDNVEYKKALYEFTSHIGLTTHDDLRVEMPEELHDKQLNILYKLVEKTGWYKHVPDLRNTKIQFLYTKIIQRDMEKNYGQFHTIDIKKDLQDPIRLFLFLVYSDQINYINLCETLTNNNRQNAFGKHYMNEQQRLHNTYLLNSDKTYIKNRAYINQMVHLVILGSSERWTRDDMNAFFNGTKNLVTYTLDELTTNHGIDVSNIQKEMIDITSIDRNELATRWTSRKTTNEKYELASAIRTFNTNVIFSHEHMQNGATYVFLLVLHALLNIE